MLPEKPVALADRVPLKAGPEWSRRIIGNSVLTKLRI